MPRQIETLEPVARVLQDLIPDSAHFVLMVFEEPDQTTGPLMKVESTCISSIANNTPLLSNLIQGVLQEIQEGAGETIRPKPNPKGNRFFEN